LVGYSDLVPKAVGVLCGHKMDIASPPGMDILVQARGLDNAGSNPPGSFFSAFIECTEHMGRVFVQRC
jgi:hypothetical protein